MPALLPSTRRSDAVPSTTVSGLSRSATTSDVRIFNVDAGRSRACGARAASTAPVSRSARTYEAAVTVAGTLSPMSPQPPSAGPPTGSAGQGSGDGVDVSSRAAGGGGACWPGHPACACAAAGPAGATTRTAASATNSAPTTPTPRTR